MQTALEWCFTGRLFGGDEAQARGLVRSVHAPADLLPAVRALAQEIATQAAPGSVAVTPQMMWQMVGAAHPMQARRIDSRAILSRGRSPDAREGIASFLEKRPPVWPDRVRRDLPDFHPWAEELPFE